MIGHTSGRLSMGRGLPFVTPTKQNLNIRSSTEADIVRVDDCMEEVCWTHYFLESQDYNVTEKIFYQENQSEILLDKNGKASSIKITNHINIQSFFVTYRINKKEVTVFGS